ncbi:MAG: hypothetical protein J6O41_07260 [Clostridia bacterium]|nr:hypothetical protein [Clostridia bacterium]
MLEDELMSLRPLRKESIHPPDKLGYNFLLNVKRCDVCKIGVSNGLIKCYT